MVLLKLVILYMQYAHLPGIMENSEIKPPFLSSEMRLSIFVNIVHGQGIENNNYLDILRTKKIKKPSN